MPYGPFLYPGATTFPDSTTYPGQGPYESSKPEVQVLVAFDDLSQTPAWQDVTALTRNWRSSRGRDDELEDISAGAASVLFDNKSRFFVPGTATPLYPSASTYPGSSTWPGAGGSGPMNRVWIKEFFNGKVRSVFYGYADSYDFSWEFLNEMAQINAADEFKVLALKGLARNDPDVETYADVVAFDDANGYWKLDDDGATESWQGTGGTWSLAGTATSSTDGPIVGDKGSKFQYRSVLVNPGNQLRSDPLSDSDAGSVDGLDEFTVELWLKRNAGVLVSERNLVVGPKDAVEEQYRVSFTTGAAVRFFTRNGAAATTDITGGLIAADGVWHHVVCTIDGGSARIYIDTAQVNSTAFTAPFGTHVDDEIWRLGDTGGGGGNWLFSNVAFYRQGLSASRVLAHYASSGRGYPLQITSARINAILDSSSASSQIPRALRTGQRQIAAAYQHGQDMLSEIQKAVLAESKDAMFFHGADVTESPAVKGAPKLVFLDGNYRSAEPWASISATFADPAYTDPAGARAITYIGLERDMSEAFLFNDWTVTDAYGFINHQSNQGSIDRYGPHGKSLSVESPSIDDNYVTDLVEKYAFPMERITAILFDTTNADTADVIFELELGDQVRVIYTPSGIDQRSFVQKIEWAGANDVKPWTCRLGISPL